MQFVEIEWGSGLYRAEVELRDELLRAPLGLAFTSGQLHAEQHELHFGMITGDKLVACLVVVPMSGQEVKIRQMCVDHAHQKQGIGAALMQQTEELLIQRGIKSIELNARNVAVGFYEKLGYEQVGSEFIEVSIPHIKMTKDIHADA